MNGSSGGSTMLHTFKGFLPAPDGVRSPAHLEAVVERFALIPYENLTKILKAFEMKNGEIPLRMPGEVLSGYLSHGTGGTCFSLTYCLLEILQLYGYICHPRMADLGGRRNNHCAVIVVLDGKIYLIDPGYLITKPLPIPEYGWVLHPTRQYPVRLERDEKDGSLYLSTLEPDGEKYRYRLHPDACGKELFFRFWRDSFSWTMMRSLLVSRLTQVGRMYVHDRYMRIYTQDGKYGKKIKEYYDMQVAELSGINPDIVRRAREVLASRKRTLRERSDGDERAS